MSQAYDDQTFEQINTLDGGEYLGCSFVNCDFSGTDLRDIQFAECHFQGCNLSNCIIEKTGFKDVDFVDCKLWGLRFDTANSFLLEMRFNKCSLNLCNFYGMDLKRCSFVNCELEEADLAEADLTEVDLSGTSLKGAMFEGANLEKADLRNAVNFQISPELTKVSGARFSRGSIEGLISHLGIELE